MQPLRRLSSGPGFAWPGLRSQEDPRARGAGPGLDLEAQQHGGPQVENGMCTQQGVTRLLLPGVWAPLEQEERGTQKQLEYQAGWGAVSRVALWHWSRWNSEGLSLRPGGPHTLQDLSSDDSAAPALDLRTQNKNSNTV